MSSLSETHYDLPSPYLPHQSGLLHLPRFIAKIKKYLKGELLPAYQRNFTKGFDGFLCLHLGIEPAQVIEVVQKYGDDERLLNEALGKLLPEPLNEHVWNRRLVQIGTSPIGQEHLQKDKSKLNVENRSDIISYADLIEFDENRLK